MATTSCPIEITRDLIAFKTVSQTPNLNIIEYLEHIFKPLGFETTRIIHPTEPTRANLLCRIGPDVEGGLMLSGHTDVVPTEGQDWHHDPFVMQEKAGVLSGRGTADMKGFIGATCHAMRQLSFKNLSKPLSLLWTYDEEVGGFGSANAAPLLHNHMKFLPSAALIGEPTSFNILRMHKGHSSVRIATKGKGAHSSNPDLGISAIKALNEAMLGIFELEQEFRRETHLAEYFDVPFVTINVGIIKGGTAVNIIPDEAHIRVGFRPLPGMSSQDLFGRIKSAAHKYRGQDAATLSVELEYSAQPLMTNAGSKLEQVLSAHASHSGPSAANFCTDAGNLAQSGIECLIFGPGSIDVAHQANEYILKDEIHLAAKKLGSIVTQFLS